MLLRRTVFLFRMLVLLPAFLLAVVGCSTKVERIGVEEVRDLSGVWNDTDSRLVSAEMIEDMLAHPWVGQHRRATGRQPAVIVGTVRNLSHEHISVNTFVNDIQRAMVNSGQVAFVASSTERGDIRDERLDQDVHARADTRNAMGQELGADYMLTGQINTIIDTEGRNQVRYYQVDLNLLSLADNRMVWLGQKKIKKEISGSKLRLMSIAKPSIALR